jgi:transcriptional regulator with GAF, ATPase, and Fis domain/tetratricopeptide (TPR) repeat protein
MSDDYRRIFTLASLFDGGFLIDWIIDLTGGKVSQVLSVLEEGTKRKILTRQKIGAFVFADVETRMRWKEIIPSEKIKQLHRQISDFLLNELPDDDTKAVRIATHLLEIPNSLENCRVLAKAGDDFLKRFRAENALQCYTKVLNDLFTFQGQEADFLFTETAIKYSKISTARHDTKKVLSILADAMVRAKRWNNKTHQVLLETHLAKNEWLCAEYTKALRHFQGAWSIAKELGNDRLLRSLANFSTFFLYWQGRFREAVENYEGVTPDVEKLPTDKFPLLAVITGGICYAHIGQVTQGLGLIDAVHTRCREEGDEYLTAFASAAIGHVLLNVRRVKDAIHFLELALEEALRSHNDWVTIMGTLMLSFAYFLEGEREKTMSLLSEFVEGIKKVNMAPEGLPYLMDICMAIENEDLPRLQGLSLKDEVDRMVTSGNLCTKGVAYRYQAFLLKLRGESHEKITQALGLSLKALEESGDIVEQTRSQLELAREYMSQGNEDGFKESVAKVSGGLSLLGEFGEGIIPDELKPLMNERPRGDTILREILKLGQEVVTIRENKELVQYIMSTVNRVTGAERGAIFLIDGDSSPPKLALRASRNLTSEQITSPAFTASMEMIEYVAREGKGQILGLSSLEANGSYSKDIIRSRICVPMILRDRLFGVLYHDNRLLGSAFKESDLELLSYFAALAAFALDNTKLYDEIQHSKQRLEGEKLYYQEQHYQSIVSQSIIGQGPAIRLLLTQIYQVARTDSTVLILGETGVGKELVARAIHRLSSRANKPFIRVDCSVLPENLIQSELFGHEKGAFTGAIQRRIGRFELADGGTLFIDEIGDLPAETQVRLLNVLQSKEFERLGGSAVIRSDFRLVTATNRDLEKEVKQNRFRSDLFYRLNVFPIYVPPLRERKEDIPLLAYHFLKVYAAKIGKTFSTIPDSEMEKLMQHDWPGNIREMEHIIERATIVNSGQVLLLPDFAISKVNFDKGKSEISLEENERRHILAALQKTGWRVRGSAGAAELLVIHPSTLSSKMRKLGILRSKGSSRKEGMHIPATVNDAAKE